MDLFLVHTAFHFTFMVDYFWITVMFYDILLLWLVVWTLILMAPVGLSKLSANINFKVKYSIKINIQLYSNKVKHFLQDTAMNTTNSVTR